MLSPTVALLALLVLSVWAVLFVLYHVVKQQGRVLLRLDSLEHGLGIPGPGAAQAPAGMAVGSEFPAFSLPDLAGKLVALEDLRGKRVLLVNWSPDCGFCVEVAPELARLQADFERRNVQLVLASSGDADSNRKLAEQHGLKCSILLQGDSANVEAFRNLGTPVAYLLDEQGRVAQPLAVGAEQVPALVRKAAAEESEDRTLLPGELPLGESGSDGKAAELATPVPSSRLAGGNDRPSQGLGDTIKRLTSAMGIKTCAGCERRRQFLNRAFPYRRRQLD
jgi:peroxiredoxin